MNASLHAVLERHRAHAATIYVLDEELGTRHGMGWGDFVLLERLEDAGGALGSTQLARTLGLRPSHLVLRLLPLEKIGWIAREADGKGGRRIVLRPAGRRLLREACETAGEACASLAGW
jgi:DNA-binding MarR family transcriptional regulator